MAENFDKKAVDDLYLWSSQRSSYLAKANASSASTLRNSSSGGSYSPWQYNSMFGMFTYVPYGGMAYSPFGWGFYSPYSVFGSPYYSSYGYGGYGYGGSIGRAVSFSPIRVAGGVPGVLPLAAIRLLRPAWVEVF